MVPQFFPCAAQVVAMHVPWPQTFGPPPPQLSVPVHMPQSTVPPQVSGIWPQFLPCAKQLLGAQPHMLATPPPPHVFGGMHDPHVNMLPQPSSTLPHSLPRPAHV